MNSLFYLGKNPFKLVFNLFCKSLDSAKSSISEDLSIIKKTFKDRGVTAHVETVPGGSRRRYVYSRDSQGRSKRIYWRYVVNVLSEGETLLPGGLRLFIRLIRRTTKLRQNRKNYCFNTFMIQSSSLWTSRLQRRVQLPRRFQSLFKMSHL